MRLLWLSLKARKAGLLAAAAIAGKLVSGMWAGGAFREKIFCGMAMVPRGEVGLIFSEVGRKSGILDETSHATVVFVVFFTTLVAPLALRWLKKGRLGQGPLP